MTVDSSIDLSSLILGFSSAALTYLDESKADEKNLALAKQHIDIIDLLDEKTKSAQTSDETQLFAAVKRDLRLKYAETVQKMGIALKV